ncbi:MAG: TIGR01212 family radical SAM protein [Spirochaetales bacterium]|nr:TIGR01212 family radical SAM protein [Spirochaetales bacterium]
MPSCPYNSYSSSLLSRYGYKVFRVGVDAGFTCPNRCSSPDGRGCIYCDSQGARAAYLRSSESGFRHDSGFESGIDTIAYKTADCLNNTFSFDYEDIRMQVERGTSFISRRYKTDHFALYLQSFSNTFAPVSRLKKLYDYALSLRSWEGFIVSTRPDCIDDEKLDLLASYRTLCGSVCVELGLQSGSDEILKAMRRGHDVDCFLHASEAVKRHGLELCVHVLTGFPGEGKAELDMTIDAVNRAHPDAIKIHNLNVAAGTELYERFLEGEVTAPCMTRHVENTVYFLRRIPYDIVVERLICETPNHRLASPRLFPDKNRFLRLLEKTMAERGVRQGDLC